MEQRMSLGPVKYSLRFLVRADQLVENNERKP